MPAARAALALALLLRAPGLAPAGRLGAGGSLAPAGDDDEAPRVVELKQNENIGASFGGSNASERTCTVFQRPLGGVGGMHATHWGVLVGVGFWEILASLDTLPAANVVYHTRDFERHPLRAQFQERPIPSSQGPPATATRSDREIAEWNVAWIGRHPHYLLADCNCQNHAKDFVRELCGGLDVGPTQAELCQTTAKHVLQRDWQGVLSDVSKGLFGN